MWRGISLANKCLLLFGAAVVLIILAALAVPFVRMSAIVDESERELSRRLVQVWQHGIEDQIGIGPFLRPSIKGELAGASIRLLTNEQVQAEAKTDPFIAQAETLFSSKPDESELHQSEWVGTSREYRYAKAVRDEAPGGTGTGPLSGMVVLKRVSTDAGAQLALNAAYLLSAGLFALGLAVLVFYLITNRLILSPVRALKETAELVREGNITVRSDIHTGDEFEQLSDTFNQMLEGIASSQDQLRAINVSLDLKVNELAERNVALFEANKLKGEFLANVSHELRTPLNSIIGFAELLIEAVEKDEAAAQQTAQPEETTRVAKRRRYLDNIFNSGKSLLEMINSLLEMAKVEAGKMDLQVELVNVREACEGLVALIRPLADRGGVELTLDLGPDLPLIETDPKKLQQIIFNLLSNAVKFTSEKAADEKAAGQPVTAKVTLRAERLVGRASEGLAAEDRVRVSVLDTGPGIAQEDQKSIFDKFHQLDTGHTRRHAGTGLGLAICKELTGLLQGEIQVESELGRGAMFSVILPLSISPVRVQRLEV